jgi:adenylyltransferase/sulfurtransferase
MGQLRFSDEELRRYSRQMILPEVGGLGQARLRSARATAGSELEALYLAGAGVGHLTVPTNEIAEAVRALNPLVDVSVKLNLNANVNANVNVSAAVRTLKELLAL